MGKVVWEISSEINHNKIFFKNRNCCNLCRTVEVYFPSHMCDCESSVSGACHTIGNNTLWPIPVKIYQTYTLLTLVIKYPAVLWQVVRPNCSIAVFVFVCLSPSLPLKFDSIRRVASSVKRSSRRYWVWFNQFAGHKRPADCLPCFTVGTHSGVKAVVTWSFIGCPGFLLLSGSQHEWIWPRLWLTDVCIFVSLPIVNTTLELQ